MKALQIANFKDELFYSNPLFSTFNIMKFDNKVILENILFVSQSIKRLVPWLIYDWLSFSQNLHRYEICWSI